MGAQAIQTKLLHRKRSAIRHGWNKSATEVYAKEGVKYKPTVKKAQDVFLDKGKIQGFSY